VKIHLNFMHAVGDVILDGVFNISFAPHWVEITESEGVERHGGDVTFWIPACNLVAVKVDRCTPVPPPPSPEGGAS